MHDSNVGDIASARLCWAEATDPSRLYCLSERGWCVCVYAVKCEHIYCEHSTLSLYMIIYIYIYI